MSTEITHKTIGDEDVPAALLEKVLLSGDLAQLTPEERLGYYQHICRSLGLNPLTRPFEYLKLSGKLVLYARRDAADQLRKIHGISITRVDVSYQDDLVVVTVDARDRAGRTDSDVGAVGLGAKRGDERANMILKAVTKAKRRVTLSICGLGMLDETEVESIPDAQEETIDLEPMPTPPGERQPQSQTAAKDAGAAEKPQEKPPAQNQDSFTRRASAALGASGARTEGKAEQRQPPPQQRDPDAALRSEVLQLLTDDPEALDVFQGSGRRLEKLDAPQLRGWKERLLERARKRTDDMPRSTVLSRQIAAARSDGDLGAARRAVQDARNAREISEAEWLSLMSETETRKSALAGPLTAGAASCQRQPPSASFAGPASGSAAQGHERNEVERSGPAQGPRPQAGEGVLA